MILLAMVLAAQSALPATSQNDISDDIIVTGRRMERLKRLRMTTKRDRATGITRCIFKRPSGDPALDAAVCDAVLACVPTANTVQEMRSCIAPAMDALVAKDAAWSADVPKDRR